MSQPHLVVYDGHTALPTDPDPATALAAARAAGGMLLMTLEDPTHDDVLRLGSVFGLEPLGVASVLRTHQRSKLTRIGDHLFVVVQPARYDDAAETVECHEVDIFLGQDFFVIISTEGAVDLEAMRGLLEQHPRLLDRGPFGVLWGVFEYVTRDYRDVLDGIEHDIDQIEEELFAEDEGVSRRIFALQREVIDLGHATGSLPEVLERIQRIVERKEQTEDAPAFREVAERARFVDQRVSGFRSTLDNALTIHSTLIDQRRNEAMQRMTETSIQQNDQVKKISSWAAIGFAPTLVAGIYGMNFQYMPELAWPWGYPFALGLMVAVSAGLYAVFKSKDWL